MTARMPILEHVLLEGERVLLRPLEPADVPAAFPLIHHRTAITDWLVWDGPEIPEELVPWYSSWVHVEEDGENYHLAVVDRETGRFCGSIGVRFAGHPFQGDLGYWLAEEKWGRGFGTEAVGLATWLAFGALRADLLLATVFEGNHGSVKVLERSGYLEVPIRLPRIVKGGREIEEHLYSLARAEWECRGRPGKPVRSEVAFADSTTSR